MVDSKYAWKYRKDVFREAGVWFVVSRPPLQETERSKWHLVHIFIDFFNPSRTEHDGTMWVRTGDPQALFLLAQYWNVHYPIDNATWWFGFSRDGSSLPDKQMRHAVRELWEQTHLQTGSLIPQTFASTT